MRTSHPKSTLLLGTTVVAGSWLGVRAWLDHWGATPHEQQRRLPGDMLMPNIRAQYTMAITIDATPEEVWPWIVQMGVDRAGLYSYLFIENTLMRLGVINAERIHPEWQDLKVGDHIWFTPTGYEPRFGPVVARLDPHEVLVLRFGEVGEPITGSWQFILEPTAEGGTRLLLRFRSSADLAVLYSLPDRILAPGYLVMSRRMLLGIKDRAERYGRTTDAHTAETLRPGTYSSTGTQARMHLRVQPPVLLPPDADTAPDTGTNTTTASDTWDADRRRGAGDGVLEGLPRVVQPVGSHGR